MTVVVSALWVVSAVWVPAVPEMVGVVELWKAAGAVTVGAGAAVSTTKVVVLVPLFPATSPWVTLAVYWALAGSAAALVVQLPAVTVGVSVWSAGPVAVAPA